MDPHVCNVPLWWVRNKLSYQSANARNPLMVHTFHRPLLKHSHLQKRLLRVKSRFCVFKLVKLDKPPCMHLAVQARKMNYNVQERVN